MVIGLVCGLVASAWPCQAGDFEENFSSDPSQRGWAVHGDRSLFGWNAADGNLGVTWDSSHANSYYYHRLGTFLDRGHDFSFSFDLRLSDIAAGTTPDKPVRVSNCGRVAELDQRGRARLFAGHGFQHAEPGGVQLFSGHGFRGDGFAGDDFEQQ